MVYYLLPDTFGLRAAKNVFKVGSVKFVNSLSPPSIVNKVRTRSKSRLKRCRAKVKGVNNVGDALLGSLFSSKVVACGHSLVTLSLTVNKTLKWLSSLPVHRKCGQCSISAAKDFVTAA